MHPLKHPSPSESPRAAAPPERMHPATAYREYLYCVRHRLLARVLDAMSSDYREQFEAMSTAVDFAPLFDLWCASQSAEIHVTACFVKQDWAVLDIRETRARFRVELRFIDGSWKVCSETPIRVAKRGAAALASVP